MSGGLVLRLKPFEKFILNGVLMQNGDRRATLTVKSEGASLLRMRDAIHPDDVDTPLKRLCYTAQLVVAGSKAADEAAQELMPGIDEIDAAFGAPATTERLDKVRSLILEDSFYLALRELRSLLPLEEMLLNNAPETFRRSA